MMLEVTLSSWQHRGQFPTIKNELAINAISAKVEKPGLALRKEIQCGNKIASVQEASEKIIVSREDFYD